MYPRELKNKTLQKNFGNKHILSYNKTFNDRRQANQSTELFLGAEQYNRVTQFAEHH